MKVIIDGVEYVEKLQQVMVESDVSLQEDIIANNDEEASRLYYAYEPLCPECGSRSFPTNFPASSVGGKESDKSVVWFCSDMGHCVFRISSSIKWQLKKKTKERGLSSRDKK